MSKITVSAKDETCTVRLPFICNYKVETTIFAHINGVRFEHGMAKKSSDIHGAYCCSNCHDVLDGRTKSKYSKTELKLAHYEAVIETQIKLIQKGLIDL